MERVLVVVDEVAASGEALPDEIETACEEASELRVVAPALNSRLHSLLSDMDGARHDADERLHTVIDSLRRHGVEAAGAVGDEDPLQAIEDALAEFPADEIMVAIHVTGHQNWREQNVADHLNERFGIPATVLQVDRDGEAQAKAHAD